MHFARCFVVVAWLLMTGTAWATPTTAPAPTPAPSKPATPKPPAPRPGPSWLTWGGSLGLGAWFVDGSAGPCSICNHIPVALATHIQGAVRIAPKLSAFADLQVHLQFVQDHEGGQGARFAQLGLFAGGQLRVVPRTWLAAGIGILQASYYYDEPSLFGSTTESESAGTGQGFLAAVRHQLAAYPGLDLGVEARLVLAHYNELNGIAPAFTIDLAFGWF